MDFFNASGFCILKDDADREDEADLIIHPDDLTPEKMAFMMRHSSGIICVPITPETAARLRLPSMITSPTDPFATGFTVTVDAKGDGVTTGVSAADRVCTAKLIADGNTTPDQLTRPGHMFPLVARAGLLDERRGHTEGSLTLMQMAGRSLVAVIGELTNDDGTMMRNEQLTAFASEHGIPMVGMSQLRSSPIAPAKPVRVSECRLPLHTANAEVIEVACRVFEHRNDTIVALVYGDVAGATRVPCRIHSGCLTGDIFMSTRCDCGEQLRSFLGVLQAHGSGVLLYVPTHEGRGIGIASKIMAYHTMQTTGCDTFAANRNVGFADDLRDFAPFQHILEDLGVETVNLYTHNPEKARSLGSMLAQTTAPVSSFTAQNFEYMRAKCVEKHHKTLLQIENMERLNCQTCPPPDAQVAALKSKSVLILRTQWNKRYVDSLTDACIARLRQCHISEPQVVTVPGAFDLVAGYLSVMKANTSAASSDSSSNRRPDVVICLGILLQGETDHYAFLMNAVGQGLMQAQLQFQVPIVNGVLTCQTERQVQQRTVQDNLGVSYANAAVEVLRI